MRHKEHRYQTRANKFKSERRNHNYIGYAILANIWGSIKRRIYKNYRTILLGLIGIGLVMILNSSGHSVVANIRSYFDRGLAIAYDKTDSLFSFISNIFLDSSEKATRELWECQHTLLQMQQIAAENASLRSLLHYVEHRDFSYITTRIIHASASSFGKRFMIAAGEEDGVSNGNIIINGEGVIGRVVESKARSAIVMPLTDPNIRIPILLLKAGKQCIASGDDKSTNLAALYLEGESDIEEGDIAITSGEGGIIPYGLKVGRLRLEEGKMMIEPAADWHKLTLVTVIVSHNNRIK